MSSSLIIMGGSEHMSYGFGSLLLVGGIAAYARKGSVPSLLAGSILGTALVGSGLLIHKGHHFEGHTTALVASSVVVGAMAARFAKTKSIVPGAIGLVGLGSTLYQGKKVLEWSPFQPPE
jgi:uncharacterized membrane protein (UPF0136 family)